MIALFGAGLAMINFAIDEVIDPKLRTQTRAVRKSWTATRAQKKAGPA